MEELFLGVDIGSTTIKFALLDATGKLVATHKISSAGRMEKKANKGFEDILSENAFTASQVVASVATGYGRRLFTQATSMISEITANAEGVKRIETGNGPVLSLLNIGGQDVKALALDESSICTNFVMNDKCAAGTGRFIEVAMKILEMEYEDLAEIDFSKVTPVNINATCTVFAESEIVSHLAQGHEPDAVMAGVFSSISMRLGRLLRRVGINDPVCIDGGPALIKGMREALEMELMRPVVVGEQPQFTTAIGAAALAMQEERTPATSEAAGA